ncbi:tetratricopeptide repeat protein [Streptomyces griseorubiginosus]|uniref:tetratricopeptide repeat protein n=1 Tax=Streptomyces griseorubiginosus TaxID=67304 RepID=UPI00332DA466
MSRLSRDKKRDQQWGATPIDVRVPLTGECATVAGRTVTAPPGEELHQAVLTHLHHLALSTGHPVHATVHDARIGYVVPLEITTDGSSRFTAEPIRMPRPEEPAPETPRPFEAPSGPILLPTTPHPEPRPGPGPASAAALTPEPSTAPGRHDGMSEDASSPAPYDRVSADAAAPAAFAPVAEPPAAPAAYDRVSGDAGASASYVPVAEPPAAPAAYDRVAEDAGSPPPYDREPEPPAAPAAYDRAPEHSSAPARPDQPARQFDEPGRESDVTFRMRKLSVPQPSDAEPDPTQALRHVQDTRPPSAADASDSAPPPVQSSPSGRPSALQAPAPGTAVPPTGAFGPPPVMDARPASAAEPLASPRSAYTPTPFPSTTPTPPPTDTRPTPLPPTDLTATPLPSAGSTPRPAPLLTPVPLLDDPDPQPAPVRGFDAVAEAVMGEGLVVEDTAVLGEPVERISAAVREGRTEAAAELAQDVVAEASRTLGEEHPDVLRVRELAAYIAYLGGEPEQAAVISLDLAGIQHRAGDAESAYGNVQSAVTAWKAVRDPSRGLALGGDLLALWTEMAAGEGPAAGEPDRLESARSRMLRLAERARRADS